MTSILQYLMYGLWIIDTIKEVMNFSLSATFKLLSDSRLTISSSNEPATFTKRS